MKKIIYILTIISFVLTSCEKSELNIFELSPKADSKTINENIETLASLISQASENVEFRQLIKNEVGKQFDGDFDALLLTFIGKEISGEKFEKILANHSDGKYTSEQIVNMIKSSGYLQMSIPVLFEEFDPIKYKPLIVAIPLEINEKTVDNFIGYDSKGTQVSVTAKSAPNEPVIVIMESERVDENGKIIVDENGFFIEDPRCRSHYSKRSFENSSKQKIKKENSIFQIVSDEEYERIMFDNKSNYSDLSKLKISKISNSTLVAAFAYASPAAVNTIVLQWLPLENANKFEIYRSGPEKINGVKTNTLNKLIGTYTNTYSLHLPVDYSNETYSFVVKYYFENQYLGESNQVSAHSSHRKNNGQEYINRVIVSKSTVTRLEGWWVSEIELRCQVAYVDYKGDLVTRVFIPVIPTYGKGIERAIDWTYSNGQQGNLITWDREGFNYGSYTIILEEWDQSDNSSGKNEKKDIMFDWIRFGLKTAGASEIWTELTDNVQKTVAILDKPDYIGEVNIKWWDPNGKWTNPTSGFSIMINHNSNNN